MNLNEMKSYDYLIYGLHVFSILSAYYMSTSD